MGNHSANGRATCKSCGESFDLQLGHECPGIQARSSNSHLSPPTEFARGRYGWPDLFWATGDMPYNQAMAWSEHHRSRSQHFERMLQLRVADEPAGGWTVEYESDGGWKRHALAHIWQTKADARLQLDDLMHKHRTTTFRLAPVTPEPPTVAATDEQLDDLIHQLRVSQPNVVVWRDVARCWLRGIQLPSTKEACPHGKPSEMECIACNYAHQPRAAVETDASR